jgi:hypothetical protein
MRREQSKDSYPAQRAQFSRQLSRFILRGQSKDSLRAREHSYPDRRAQPPCSRSRVRTVTPLREHSYPDSYPAVSCAEHGCPAQRAEQGQPSCTRAQLSCSESTVTLLREQSKDSYPAQRAQLSRQLSHFPLLREYSCPAQRAEQGQPSCTRAQLSCSESTVPARALYVHCVCTV